jgi:short-subunit dehydrogenase
VSTTAQGSSATPPVILITGTSSGLGKACAEYLSQQGMTVYGTSRHPEKLNPKLPWTTLTMDVRDEASVKVGVETILKQEGRLNVVVNNAGFGIAGAIEDTSIEEAQAQFETNFFGTLRVICAALPIMRQQGSGTIINIGSIGGLIGLPFQGLYSATKFAMEGFSEALSKEVRPWGIHVVLVEPGDFHTAFTDNRQTTKKSTAESPYWEFFSRALAIMQKDESQGDDPQRVARLVERIIHSSRPRLRYRVGFWSQKAAATLKAFLPERLFDWIIRSHYGVT